MAKRTTRTKPRAGKDPVAEAVRLAGLTGWRDLSLSDVAAACGLPMSVLYPRYPSKSALAAAFMARIDQEMLERLAAEDDDGGAAVEPLRDRLFSAIMARFDALQPHRDGVVAIARDSLRDPVLALRLSAGPMRRSIDCLLEAVGLPAEGLAGIVRRKVVGGIYLAAFRTWTRDNSADMGATMAVLERALTRCASLLDRMERRNGPRPDPARNDAPPGAMDAMATER